MRRHLAVACAAVLAAAQAWAQADERTRCQQEVHRYEENMRLVKATLGAAAYEALKARQLPDAERDALLYQGGYCAVARVLRQRKLIPPAPQP